MRPTVFMDVEVWPHRSLPPAGLRLLLGVMLALDLALGGVLVALHAVVAAPFALIGAGGLCLAFVVSNRSLTRRERIWVGDLEVRVLRGSAGAEALVWSSPTRATRAELQRTEFAAPAVVLHAAGRRLCVGVALSPPERTRLAEALALALARARSA